jgi:hypothetical protein
MAKNLFGGVRASLVGTLVATIGGLALTACNSCCNSCNTCRSGPPVYKAPCCAQGGYGMPATAPTYAPAPMAPAGGGKACGGGKCG